MKFGLVLLVLMALLPCKLWANGAEMGDEPIEAVFRVGVLSNHGVAEAKVRWQPMMEYLSSQVAGIRFEAQPLDFDAMRESLLDLRIQFIVTNPGQYLSLSNEMALSWLATMRSRNHNGATYAIGSAILVRGDSPIQNIEELKGASIVASDPQALGGYQATIGLLNRRGLDSARFFGDVRFLGFPLEPLVYQVRDGMVDAAITPFCTLEEMVTAGLVAREDFRVLNAVQPEGYDCETSTSLYPNWSFAATDKVPARITQQVTKALFELSPSSQAAISARTLGWTAPISQLTVVKLYEELKLHTSRSEPFEQVRAWLNANRQYAAAAAVFLLSGMFYHLWLEYRFRQKSGRLLAAERSLRDKELMLERMQSAAVLGEIGAGLAHELNQPIAAITQYSEGVLHGLKSRPAMPLQDVEPLEKIHAQSLRAGAVVHRIRSLLKRERGVQELIWLESIIQDTLPLLERECKNLGVSITQQGFGTPAPVLGDSVALSQLLVNLIKNALEALACVDTQAKIQLMLHYEACRVTLILADNGGGLLLDADAVTTSFVSTKPDGLGLGLAICRDVVARHGGTMAIGNVTAADDLPWQQGCIVKVALPLAT